jgi:hypothetical protein
MKHGQLRRRRHVNRNHVVVKEKRPRRSASRARGSRPSGIHATAAALAPRPAPRHGPETRRRGEHGRSPRDSRAPSPSALFPTSRTLRRRVCAWPHRGHASGAGEPRPFPGQATGGCVAASRGQRLRRWALSPRWRAGSPTPSPLSVTRRTAARAHASPSCCRGSRLVGPLLPLSYHPSQGVRVY